VSVTREAFVLPLLFLTVALLGGLRIDGQVHLVPPSLMALVLGTLLMGVLVRGRGVAPELLLSTRRTPLENVSGGVVLIALLAASAQIFNLVTPEGGLFHVVFTVFFLVQLLTTLAGGNTRTSLLRSLFVLLASAFVLRFVVLEGLYAPESGTLKRVLTALLEGVSLGAIGYHPHAAATGYVAFLTIALYMIGLVALPAASGVQRGALQPLRHGGALLLVCLMVGATACGGKKTDKSGPDSGTLDPAGREAAWVSAQVWREPATPIPQFDFTKNPEGPKNFATTDDVSCRFVVHKGSGLTPKFSCELPGGEVVKVKYGRANGELPSEVAATRLMASLGFGADRMYVVRQLHCAGCPAFPFQALKCMATFDSEPLCFLGGIDYEHVRTFDPVVVERRMEGRKLEAAEDQGWSWHELDRIEPARGGASRADVDAFRLLAVLLAHWDNKGGNQRLICPPDSDRPDGGCAAPPLAIITDAGATFGPTKIDLHNWRHTPVWADQATCTVSMKRLPWNGATFPDARISEEGRLKMLGLLEQLSDQQLRDLFSSSRVTAYDQISAAGRDAGEWVRVFKDKVAQIRQTGPCPSSS